VYFFGIVLSDYPIIITAKQRLLRTDLRDQIVLKGQVCNE